MKTHTEQVVIHIPEEYALSALAVFQQIQARAEVISTNFDDRSYFVKVTYDPRNLDTLQVLDSIKWSKKSMSSFLKGNGLLPLIPQTKNCLECGKQFQVKKNEHYCSRACKQEYVMKRIKEMQSGK